MARLNSTPCPSRLAGRTAKKRRDQAGPATKVNLNKEKPALSQVEPCRVDIAKNR